MQESGRNENRLRLAFGMLVVLAIALVVVVWREAILAESDIWWHIRTGRWIVERLSFPTTDSYSFTYAGQPWIAKEWLSQVLFHVAHRCLGWNGVALLSVLALAVAAGVLYRAVSVDLAPLPAMAATLVSLMLACPAFTARPHLLTLALAIIWTRQLFSAADAARPPPPALLVVMVLWANLHGAFTLGFVIAACAFLDCALRLRLSRPDLLLKWLVFLALCPLASLLHPYGWKAMLASWWIAGPNTSLPLITEWQPLIGQGPSAQGIALMLMLLASLVAGFRLSAGRALLLVLLVHLTFAHGRFVFYLFPLLPVLVASALAQRWPLLSAGYWRTAPRDGVERALLRFHWPVLASLLGGLVLVALAQAILLPSTPPMERNLAGALAAARRLGLTGHVFNDYDFGGPLIFYGIPTFIDGRPEQLFLGDFAATFMLGPSSATDLAAAFTTYDISWTLLPAHDPRNALIAQLPHWRRAYADSAAVIFRREP